MLTVACFGRSSPNFVYYLRESTVLTKQLEKTQREKGLGGTFQPDLNWKYYIHEVTLRAA